MKRVVVTWSNGPSTFPPSPVVSQAPTPPNWHILKNGVKIEEAGDFFEAVEYCQHLHEAEPLVSLELRDGSNGDTRLWHPDYPRGRSLGLWEDLIHRYEPFRDILRFVRETTGKQAILAGGCIRDVMVFERPDEIKDFDCFVLDTAEAEDEHICERLREAATDAGGSWSQGLWIRRYNDITQFNRFVAELELPWAPAKKPIQIITSLATSAEEVVSHFDWTACMFWYDGRTIGTTGMSDFCIGNLTTNYLTEKNLKRVLRRGYHLEEKLEHSALPLKLTEATILQLASQMNLDPQLRDGRVDTLSEVA